VVAIGDTTIHFISFLTRFLSSLGCWCWFSKAAAHRLMRYWHLRRKLFGDTFHLRMTLHNDNTNNGNHDNINDASAITVDDRVTLQHAAFLPCPPDTHGRSVLYWHRSKSFVTRPSKQSVVSSVIIHSMQFIMDCNQHHHRSIDRSIEYDCIRPR
jgi:hypothetical protein